MSPGVSLCFLPAYRPSRLLTGLSTYLKSTYVLDPFIFMSISFSIVFLFNLVEDSLSSEAVPSAVCHIDSTPLHGWLSDMQPSRISFLHTAMEPKTPNDDVMSSTGQSFGSRATWESQSKCRSPNKTQKRKEGNGAKKKKGA